ncbi:unnamed protein product [Clavelina lepadiformis]|uniref:Major facilitator superfamily (MFS) profile domain-containing protein n=1 Tax=Clavelina lepadiformis TaxID=159417 RepID=A0ABP0H3H5_CLALP
METRQTLGLFEKRALIVLLMMTFCSANVIVLCNVFVLYSPPHRCYVSGIDGSNISGTAVAELPPTPTNSSSGNELYIFIQTKKSNNDDATIWWDQCHRYNFDEIQDNATSAANVNLTIGGCDEGWKYYANNGEISAVMEFDLVCNDAWQAPLAPSFVMFGFMAGSMIGSFLSDRYGRRFALILTWVVLSLSMLLLAVTPFWSISYVLWFLVGCCSITRATTSMVIVNELTPEKYRRLTSSVMMAVCSFGYVATPLMAYVLPNWRHQLILLGGAQLSLLLPCICYVKESLHWLIQNKKYEAATILLQEISRINKKEYEEPQLLLATQATELNENQVKESKNKKQTSYIDFVKYSFLRRRVLIFSMAWFSTTVSYYGLSLNTNNLGGNRYLTCFIAGAVDFPGDLLCFFLIKKIGGRLSFVTMAGVCSVCLLMTPILSSAKWVAVTISMIGKLFIAGAFANNYLFTGDLFPTLHRSQSYGACSFISRIGGILVPFMLQLGQSVHESIPYFVCGTVTLFATMAMYFLPETKSMPLPDTMEDAKLQDRNSARVLCYRNSGKKQENKETEIDSANDELTTQETKEV